jgi:hypothetical protein
LVQRHLKINNFESIIQIISFFKIIFLIFQIKIVILMLDSNISLKIKNKIEKSSIIKLSDIDYIKILTLNIKYYMFKNFIQNAFL